MKKNILSVIAVVLVAIASVVVYSCSKDNNTDIDKNNTTTIDQQVESRIIAFRDKIDVIRNNPGLKTGTEPMEIDSAVWYIEATSNMTYGDASSQMDIYIVDSSFIEVPITNGNVLWSDVQIAYDEVVDSLSAHNAAIPSDEKQLVVADISLKESDDNTAIFEVTSGFSSDLSGDGLGLGNTYSWYWGFELGRCDGTGLGVGYDAADKIAQLANYEVSVPMNASYYTDVNIVFQIVPTDVPTLENPYGDYLLFYGHVTYPNYICMDTDEISYYKNALIQIGNDDDYKPIGKSVIRYYLCDDLIVCNNITTVFHKASIKYGIWHLSGGQPEDL